MILRGRVLKFDNGFYILSKNDYVSLSGNFEGEMNDIVELHGEFKNSTFFVDKTTILQKGSEIKGNENWKKIIYDRDAKIHFLKISEYIEKISDFFKKNGFLSVYTPILGKYAAMEPNIDSFETKCCGEKLYLQTSPEYFMKKLLTSGISEKIFSMTPVFRNNEVGKRHNPEFLMVEWYRAYEPYEMLMEDLFALLKYLLPDNDEIIYDGNHILLDRYEKLTVEDALKKYAETDFEKLGVYEERPGWEEDFFKIMVDKVEPKLGFERPLFLYEYPRKLAALSKIKDDNPQLSKRFEFYICGVELANCFEELTDYKEQFERFKIEKNERKIRGLTEYEIDMTFIEALKIGMPPASGGALGVNRLLQILTDSPDIKNTFLFPYIEL